MLVRKYIFYCAIVVNFTLSKTAGAEWQPMNIPGAGNIAVHGLLTYGLNLYAATAGTGILVSPDSGNTWSLMNNGITDMSVRCFADSGGTLFAGTDGGGVYSSQDSGVSWQIGNINIDNFSIHAMLEYNGVLFAGTDAGAFYSTNNGGDWNPAESGLITPRVNGLCLSTDGLNELVYAGTDTNGVFLSSDDSANWFATSSQRFAAGNINTILATFTYVIIGTNNGIWRSADNGMHWEASSVGLEDSVVYSLAIFGNFLLAGTRSRGVYYSSDYGATWRAANMGLTDTSIFSFTALGSYVYMGGNSNVWRGVFPDVLSTVKKQENSVSPLIYSLSQNYPNPFSTSTTIDFSLPEPVPVTLKVYNALGDEVATLASGEFSAGVHAAVFDARSVNEGVYFYKLTAGTYSQTGTMAVVK